VAAYGQPGAAVPAGMYFDADSGLVLPDGVQLASIGRRIGAFFLAIPLSIVTLGIGYAVWGLIVWGRGQTPALQVLGMRRPARRGQASRRVRHRGALRPDGSPPGGWCQRLAAQC
jgi:hypothetical protein